MIIKDYGTSMSIIRKFKLDYDWKEFVRELDELFPLEVYEEHIEHPNPLGIWYHNISEENFPKHLQEAIERGIGYPIKKKGWMWDWRCQTTELLEHVDTLSNAHVTGISEWDKVVFEDDPSKFGRPPITVNIAMENDVHLYVKNNEAGDYEHCIYGPGDIVMFNNNTQKHGVYVLNDPTNIPRRALNCYLDVDDLFDTDHDFWQQPTESVPWPIITTTFNTRRDKNEKFAASQKVPLQTEYSFNDMAYLDTPEAYPMFEQQANIIIEKQCKGIVDMGCRHGPVIDILHAKGYTDFQYMGIDTSKEPIELAHAKWKDYDNIEFRRGSWEDDDVLHVDFDVDQVIWSGVLLYRPDDHYEFFDKITRQTYNSPNAIIQEPQSTQRHWKFGLELNTIANQMQQYQKAYNKFTEYHYDLEIFAGRRLVVDVTL